MFNFAIFGQSQSGVFFAKGFWTKKEALKAWKQIPIMDDEEQWMEQGLFRENCHGQIISVGSGKCYVIKSDDGANYS